MNKIERQTESEPHTCVIVVSLEAGSGLWELGRGAGGRLACGRVARGLVT